MPAVALLTLSLSAIGTVAKDKAVTPLPPPDSLPVAWRLPGKLLDLVRWRDAGGENLLAVAEVGNGDFGEPGYRSELHALQLVSEGTKKARVWKLYDFNSNALESMAYSRGSYAVRDLDGDGHAEVAFWYYKTCDGMDPDTLKYMLYSRGRKYAIRGTMPKHVEDMGRYGKRLDPSFSSAPKGFQAHASSEWERLVRPVLKELREGADEE